jgi:hypothetical protein
VLFWQRDMILAFYKWPCFVCPLFLRRQIIPLNITLLALVRQLRVHGIFTHDCCDQDVRERISAVWQRKSPGCQRWVFQKKYVYKVLHELAEGSGHYESNSASPPLYSIPTLRLPPIFSWDVTIKLPIRKGKVACNTCPNGIQSGIPVEREAIWKSIC